MAHWDGQQLQRLHDGHFKVQGCLHASGFDHGTDLHSDEANMTDEWYVGPTVPFSPLSWGGFPY